MTTQRFLNRKAVEYGLLYPTQMKDPLWQAEILGQAMLIMRDSPRIAKHIFRRDIGGEPCYCTFGAIRRAIAEWEWKRDTHDNEWFMSKDRNHEDSVCAPFSMEIQQTFGDVLANSLSTKQRALAAQYGNEHRSEPSREVMVVNDAKGTRKDSMVRVLRRASVLAQSMVGHRAEKP